MKGAQAPAADVLWGGAPVKHDKAAVVSIWGGTNPCQDQALVWTEAAHRVAVVCGQVFEDPHRVLELAHIPNLSGGQHEMLWATPGSRNPLLPLSTSPYPLPPLFSLVVPVP